MKRVYIVFLFSCVCQLTFALSVQQIEVTDSIKLDSTVQKYTDLLMQLVARNDSVKADSIQRANPSTYRLLTQGTLYDAPMQQEFSFDWSPSLPAKKNVLPSLRQKEDEGDLLRREENAILMQTYVSAPWLIKTTETMIEESGGIHEETLPKIPQKIELQEHNIECNYLDDIEPLHLNVRRPNFWSFKGNYSLQFTQTYFSENWYQGGENNYSMLALATMEANFDNKKKVQWENKLELRLGFQTSKGDEMHKFKTNDDLIRLTSKIGYKATKHWFYTLQVQANTQFYPSYKANSNFVTSDFMSPFNMVVSLGMDYKWQLKRFRGSANLSPVAYNFKCVTRPSLYGNFGLEPGKKTYNNFGPNVTINYTWDIWKNIRWDARIYWFSNMKMTDIEWENTFTFTINKYLNSKLFLYPRIDDSSEKYRNEEKGSYFMFKEWFSLGLNYSF